MTDTQNTTDWVELGNEYGRLVLAAEHGVDPWGDPAKGNSKREYEIEQMFAEAGIDYLQDYVECVFEAAEEDGII
jgi:hypothetical protein